MEILAQIMAKSKAESVIESSDSMAHFSGAEKYIQLYYNKFEDRLGYEYLKRELKQARLDSLQS